MNRPSGQRLTLRPTIADIRTGDYRVQFFIDRGKPASEGRAAELDTVVVEKVGYRDGFL